MTLDEIIELGKRATPRPWQFDDSDQYDQIYTSSHGRIAGMFGGPTDKAAMDTAKFMVAACNAAPLMAEKLKRLREILGPKLEYAINNASNPYNVMIGPFSDNTARLLTELLSELPDA